MSACPYCSAPWHGAQQEIVNSPLESTNGPSKGRDEMDHSAGTGVEGRTRVACSSCYPFPGAPNGGAK